METECNSSNFENTDKEVMIIGHDAPKVVNQLPQDVNYSNEAKSHGDCTEVGFTPPLNHNNRTLHTTPSHRSNNIALNHATYTVHAPINLPAPYKPYTTLYNEDLTLEMFSKLVETMLLEFYVHGNTEEVAERLDDILTGPLRPCVTSLVVEISFDYKNSQRELTSMLISDLYGRVLTGKDIELGFADLLENLPDLILDTPEAPVMLGNFMARAITDDCLPPKFLMHRNELNELAIQAIKRANMLLNWKSWNYPKSVWGIGGPLIPVTSLIKQIDFLLKEYLCSWDLQEALYFLHAMEVPHFHHELVYDAIIKVLESLCTYTTEKICALLKALDDCCLVSPASMELGFRRVIEDLADLILDIPMAYIILQKFLRRCYDIGLISKKVLYALPNRPLTIGELLDFSGTARLFCLIVFTLFTIIATVTVLLSAPHIIVQ